MKRLIGLVIVAFIAWAVFHDRDNQALEGASQPAPARAAETPRESTSVDNAYAVCQVIDGTGLASKPCEVSGWNSAVIATIDMSSVEARKLCPQIAGLLRDKSVRFKGEWTLQIRSPYSGDNSIAFCRLPN